MKVDIVMACMILGERFRLKQRKTGFNGSPMTTPSKSRFVRVPITTKVASSNSVQGEVYSIEHYVIKLVSDLRTVQVFFCPVYSAEFI
jgi:hypothetical protein